MKKEQLQRKTPEQLLTHLRNNRWTKEIIVDFIIENCLEDADNPASAYVDLMLGTYLQICEKYHDDIVDYIWEAYCDA